MSKKKEAPKKDKKTAQSKPPTVIDDREPWINELKSLVINDDSWQCNVNMIVERSAFNKQYTDAANDVFSNKQNHRRSIKVLSNTLLATETLEISYCTNSSFVSNGYKKLCDNVLQFCSPEGFSQSTPAHILASLIKYYIYSLKLKNLEETRIINEYLQKKQKLREESLLSIQNITKNLQPSKEQTSAKSKKDTKDKASKKDTKSASSKQPVKEKVQEGKFTEIRKRGEEVLDIIAMHSDEPEDGPQLHIILNSFSQSELPLELLKLKVPLTALVKLNDFCKMDENDYVSEDENLKISNGMKLVCNSPTFKQRRFSDPMQEYALNNMILDAFWKQFFSTLNNKDNILLFKDTIFLKFYPRLLFPLPTKKKKKQNTVYEDIKKSFYNQLCHLQYDIQDVKRQHQNFINHLVDRNLEEKMFYDFDKMNVYIAELEGTPPEMINVPFILHSMLIQVEHLVDQKGITTEEPTSYDVPTNETDINLEDDSLKIKLAELDKTHDLFYTEEEKGEDVKILPIVLVYGDKIGIKARNWENANHITNINYELSKCFWEVFLDRQLPVYDDISLMEFRDAVDLFTMLTDSGDLSVRDRLCKLPCIFKDTAITVENKATVFCSDEETGNTSQDTLSWNSMSCNYRCFDVDSKDYIHYQDPSEGHFLGQTYDEHSYCFEEMTPNILLQNLCDYFENFNCVDLLRDCFRNKFFIKFHHRKICCKKEYRMGTLKTKTAIRDFYDYTIDEEFYWLNEYELLYNKMLVKKELNMLTTGLSRLKYLKNRISYMTDKICSETNFIMHNTLKHSGDAQPTDLLNIPSYTEEELEIGGSLIEVDADHLQSFDIDLPFRVQFSEWRREFIVSKNSQLGVKMLTRLYKEEALSLQTTIHGHTLYFYQPIGGNTSTNFHLIHSSGIVFYFKKNKIDSAVNDNLKKDENMNDKLKIATTETNVKDITETTDVFLKPLFYELCLSLPSSLYLEFINPNNISLYVKQYYLDKKSIPEKLQNERFRCYLTEGKLLKFMTDDTVIIYYPTSEIFVYNDSSKSKTSESTTSPSIVVQNANALKAKEENKLRTKGSKDQEPISNGKTKDNLGETIESYDYTSAAGRRISFNNGQATELEQLFCRSFMDIFNGAFITERSDGTLLTCNKQGTLFVDFPDGSRITTMAYFSDDEIVFDVEEDSGEGNENNAEDLTNAAMILNFDRESFNQELDENTEASDIRYNLFPKSEAFTVVNIHHYFEHENFAAISIDLNKEDITINLPCNVNISLSSEGLYTMNLDHKAEVSTGYDNLIFREVNDMNLPEFTLHLSNQIPRSDTKQDNYTRNENTGDGDGMQSDDADTDMSENHFVALLSCRDNYGNALTIDINGIIHEDTQDGIPGICKCDILNMDRLFIFDIEYNGLELFSPETLDYCDTEASQSKNCVVQHYGTVDHQVELVLKPLQHDERDKWLVHLKPLKLFPLYVLPSTYNDDRRSFCPFPKTRPKPTHMALPSVLLVRVINRVNCNLHLQKEAFLQNKEVVDFLRLNKCPELATKLFERGNIPLCKADKAFIKYIKDIIIGSLISRVRRRVVKRLEMRKIQEYTHILVNRLLLPYFDSAQGAVFVIMLDVMLNVVQLSSEERHKLETLFCRPLHQLTDADLDYMHDRIAPLTVSRFCICDESKDFCQLRILLLAGKSLHDIFPDMISVFYSYGRNVKAKRQAETRKVTEEQMRTLLIKPSDALTDEDLIALHDILCKLPIIPFCSCYESNEDIYKCKLKAILLACAVLSYIFPNVYSVLQYYKIEIDLHSRPLNGSKNKKSIGLIEVL